MVYKALPYVCTYKAKFKAEIEQFAAKVIEDSIEEHTIEVEEERLPSLNKIVVNSMLREYLKATGTI